MEEYSGQKEQPRERRPDPALIGVVAYLEFLAQHPEYTDKLEKRLAEYALLCPLLFELYQEDPVSGRAILHEVAHLLSVNVGQMVAEFERMSKPEEELRPNGAVHPQQEGLPYQETPAGIIWHRPTKDGQVDVLLTNFTARIVSDLLEDDGTVDLKHYFEVEIRQGGRTGTVKVPSARYDAMAWPTEVLGAKAILSPGQGAKEHARYAIQMFSQDACAQRAVYTHLGWRKIGGQWVYLHAGGAIG